MIKKEKRLTKENKPSESENQTGLMHFAVIEVELKTA